MAERKAWSEQEDAVLKKLREQRGITRWAEISRIMQEQFKINGRTGKQCRQRYHNHLDHTIKRDKWLPQEENDLIQLHNAMGNRWAQISRAITGRSENCVKNKFYSILRKGLRCINIAIKKHLKKYKQLDISVVYKLIEACESNYMRRNLTKEMQTNFQMKKQIIYYGMKKEGQLMEEELVSIKTLVQQIKTFLKGKNSKTQLPPIIPEQPRIEEEIAINKLLFHKHSSKQEDIPNLQYVFKQQPKRTSLHSMISEKNEFLDPFRSRSSNRSYPSLRSKNLSNISNASRLSRELRTNQFARMDTIKSLQLPEFQPIKSVPALQFMESYNFQQPKMVNSNSFSLFLHN